MPAAWMNERMHLGTEEPRKWEWLLPALGCVSLIVACVVISARKYYWNDELFSYYFVSDPSFASMLASFNDKLNNTPLLYFAIGWVWDKVFGSAELSLRLFSSLGICLALVLTWSTLRRSYGFWPVALGVLAVFGTSRVILLQNSEARMYGLFLVLCAAAYMLYDRTCRIREPGSRLLWLNAVVHACIIHTHLFGAFYSGAILVAVFLADRYAGHFRPRVYLSIILSWLTIIFYIPSFLIQADAGRPRTWIPFPDLKDLLDVMNLTASPFFQPLILLLPLPLLVLYLIGRRRIRISAPGSIPGRYAPEDLSNLLFSAVFLSLPIFIWLFSVTIRPILFDRYMIPTAIGWAILFAAVLQRCISSFSLGPASPERSFTITRIVPLAGTLTVLGALAIFLLNPIRVALKIQTKKLLEDVVDLKGHDDLPIVIQTGGAFLENLHYASEPDRYFYIMDWEAAIDDHSGLFTPQEYKHMEAWKRRFPELFKNVVGSDEFLDQHERFLVLDFPEPTQKCPPKPVGLRHTATWQDLQCPQWVEMRLLNNSDHKVTHLGNDQWYSVLLVEKRSMGHDLIASREVIPHE
jgi:hypothetical protein